MKRRRSGVATAVVVCASLLALTNVFAEENALEKEPYGYFRPAGKVAAAFADVAELHLGGGGEYGAQATPPYFGMLRTKGRTPPEFRLRERTISGREIRFTTEQIGGISYRFSGNFARLNFHDGGVPIDEVMLSGTIVKLRGGKTIASAPLSFFFEAGG
jgi:hypothetical protein